MQALCLFSCTELGGGRGNSAKEKSGQQNVNFILLLWKIILFSINDKHPSIGVGSPDFGAGSPDYAENIKRGGKTVPNTKWE